MPRTNLEPLQTYIFNTHITVRTTDVNYGGHLGNDRMLSLVHEARIAFLALYGWSEKDCGGVSLTLADAVLNYKHEAFGGDILQFDVTASEPSRCGFRLFYRVTRPTDNQLIALVETGVVCYDYETGKIKSLPAEVRKICI